MVRAVFFDRDGVLIKPAWHSNRYTAAWHIDEYKLLPSVKKGVALIKGMGFQTHVITNQPDVNDKKMTQKQLDLIHKQLKSDTDVDTINYCSIRNSECYKPNTGMVDRVCREYKIERHRSYFIGDSWKDVVCGSRSGMTTIYVYYSEPYQVQEGLEHIRPDYIVNSTYEACELIYSIERLRND